MGDLNGFISRPTLMNQEWLDFVARINRIDNRLTKIEEFIDEVTEQFDDFDDQEEYEE